jgi:uncharacterized membrane protein YgcG
MAFCSAQTGMLFWKKQCDHPSVGHCSQCSRIVCQQHSGVADGAFLCRSCYAAATGVDDDSGSGFSWSSSDSSSSSDGSWSGGDSGGSSDSGGGGDSGGSSGD